jgi:2,3-bisphosphoglycerate-independent phosphoglycerate mutase
MNEEEDWEKIDVVDFSHFRFSKEEERKLAERKLVEEDDNQLTNDLFQPITNNQPIINNQRIVSIKTETTRPTRPKKPAPFIKNSVNANATIRSNAKERKEIIKRRKEIFGEAELDEYEERYGYIADI